MRVHPTWKSNVHHEHRACKCNTSFAELISLLYEPWLPVNKSHTVSSNMRCFKWQFPVKRKTEIHQCWKALPRKDETGASMQLFTELPEHFSRSFFFSCEKTGLFPASELRTHFLLWKNSFKGKRKHPTNFVKNIRWQIHGKIYN